MPLHRQHCGVLKGRPARRGRCAGALCIHDETLACPPDGEADTGAPIKNHRCRGGFRVSATGIYKGYTFADVSTPLDNGRYRARVAIMAIDGTRTRSQRFLDLEVFANPEEAGERVVAVARAWIDANAGNDQLALPTNFAALD